MCYSVYVIYSESSDYYYRGQTKNLDERISRHNNAREKSTRHGVPWRLVWFTHKPDRSSALRLEKKLKNLSRKRLENFIRKNSDDPGL
jgi:putative endonuclease